MKKRFLLPAIAVSAIAIPITIGVIDALVHMAGCNFGHQGACSELAKRRTHSDKMAAERAKEQDAKPVTAKPAAKSDYESCLEVNKQLASVGVEGNDCERVKNWQSPQQRLAAAGGRTQLIRTCEASFKPMLKDPGSYRFLDADVVATANNGFDVTVRYTATNSFGGHVQQKHTCAA